MRGLMKHPASAPLTRETDRLRRPLLLHLVDRSHQHPQKSPLRLRHSHPPIRLQLSNTVHMSSNLPKGACHLGSLRTKKMEKLFTELFTDETVKRPCGKKIRTSNAPVASKTRCCRHLGTTRPQTKPISAQNCSGHALCACPECPSPLQNPALLPSYQPFPPIALFPFP